jgi:serine protease
MDWKTFVISPSSTARRRGVAQALRRGSLGLGLAVGLTMLSAGGAWAAQPEAQSDRLIVKMRAEARSASVADPSARAAVAVAGNRAGLRITRLRGMGSSGAHVLKLDKPLGLSALQSLADEIRAGDADVEYVEPDLRITAQWVPNDACYPNQWNLAESTAGVNLPPAWDLSRGLSAVVAVIDTGVLKHAELAHALLPGYDFISEVGMANDGGGRDADATDPGDWVSEGDCGPDVRAHPSTWHGTHVAGIIAAQADNKTGIAGVAPDARIVPVRVLGRCGGYSSDLADAVIWASGGEVAGVPRNANPAQVLNLSLGSPGLCGPTMQAAIDGARSRGSVVVAGAGNSTSDVARFSPANCKGVIAVASVKRNGSRASDSNYGDLIDVAAPGTLIQSTFNMGEAGPGSDTYALASGTSMAAPHVSGVVALMRSVRPSLTPDEIEARLKSSAAERGFPQPCVGCGTGIVDARRALVSLGVTVAEVNEVEPNNTPATGQKVTPRPAKVLGRTDRTSEVDYYEVNVPAGKSLKAVLAPSATADLDLHIYLTNGLPLSTGGLVGRGKTETLNVRNTGSTLMTVALKVFPRAAHLRLASHVADAWSAKLGAVGSYELTLSE